MTTHKFYIKDPNVCSRNFELICDIICIYYNFHPKLYLEEVSLHFTKSFNMLNIDKYYK